MTITNFTWLTVKQARFSNIGLERHFKRCILIATSLYPFALLPRPVCRTRIPKKHPSLLFPFLLPFGRLYVPFWKQGFSKNRYAFVYFCSLLLRHVYICYTRHRERI